MHDELEVHLDKMDDHLVDPENHAGDGRMLATAYGGLRLYVDYSKASVVSTELAYMKKLVTAAANFFFKTLSVPQLSVLKIPESQESMCGGLTIPSAYRTTGVQADMVFFVTAENSYTGFLAWSRACKLLSSTGRPVVGQINFNTNSLKPNGGDSAFTSDLMTVVHEMTHALGFSDSLFDNFINPVKVGKTTLGGNTYSYLSVEPLNSKLKAYFGCSSLPGAILENQGGSGSAGSHWERRIFGNEYMTASQINDQRVSSLTLALLESTGWYQVDYSMADTFSYGQGEGCGFLSSHSGYKEYCSGSAEGCTFHGQAGAYCGSDSFSDGVPYMRAYSNRDCQNTANAGASSLSAESYGYGSQCFTGTLYPGGALSATQPYCFKHTCVASSTGGYQLNIHVGSATGVCKAKGRISVSGYSGSLNCPDPNTYCTTIGKPACRRGCMGKGTCSGGICQCYSGWGGYDCSKKTASLLVDGAEKVQDFDYTDLPESYVPNDSDAPKVKPDHPANYYGDE
jgi:leishmanolysin